MRVYAQWLLYAGEYCVVGLLGYCVEKEGSAVSI